MQAKDLPTLKPGDILVIKRGYINAGFKVKFIEMTPDGRVKVDFNGRTLERSPNMFKRP